MTDKADFIILASKEEQNNLPAELSNQLKFLAEFGDNKALYLLDNIFPCEQKTAMLQAISAARFHHAYLKGIFSGNNLPVMELSSPQEILDVSDQIKNPLGLEVLPKPEPRHSDQAVAVDLAVRTAA